MKRIAWLASILLFGVGWTATAIAADNVTTLSVAPAIVNVSANPGETITRELIVRNQADASLPVSLSANPLYIEHGLLNFDTSRYDASNWVQFQQQTYVFAPDETKKLPVTIAVPSDAAPGGHYTEVSIRGLSREQTNSSQTPSSTVVPEVNASVLITVAGAIDESLHFERADSFPLRLGKTADVTTTVTVRNTGNVHNLVTPQIIIVDSAGTERAIPMQTKLILPGTATTFSHSWQGPAYYGTAHAFVRLQYGQHHTVIESPQERVYITPNPWLLLGLLVIFASAVYLIWHRNNLSAAWQALVKPRA